MKCSIDWLHDATEEAWIIAIPFENVQQLITLFTAYEFGKIERINMQDTNGNFTVQIEHDRINEKSNQDLIITHGKKLRINRMWRDAVVSMLLDVSVFGWSDTAHLDYDFSTSEGIVTVCISVAPPTINY